MNDNVKKLRQFLPRVFSKKIPKKIIVVEILEAESRKLNREYRGKNKSANTLSFRYGSDYGEILVCPEVIRREAKEQGKTYKYQMTWMVIHGMLHLAEIHHERSRGAAKRVEVLEERILRKLFS